MQLDNFHPHKTSEFGSYNIVIRSKGFHRQPNREDNVEQLVGKENRGSVRFESDRLKSASYYFGEPSITKFNSLVRLVPLNNGHTNIVNIKNNYDTAKSNYNQINKISTREKRFYQKFQIPSIKKNSLTEDYIKNIYQSKNAFSYQTATTTNNSTIANNLNLVNFNKLQTGKTKFDSQSYNNFVYNRVSNNILTSFGGGESLPSFGQEQKYKLNKSDSSNKINNEKFLDSNNQITSR